ncbi:cupin domain-containing protein [Leucobacter ruminantium]|uniref:Cupin domain-containing protein n=1 Tax=Leucobacter ruminantium TaxID=1289170 RepID=A0A939S058_9MICO|nr:cupin domain-containing protein [Leucobacter ruminantium]MBO1806541.1 cupin domain-containing protein [Leucobacter ruminantium]
MSENLLPEGRNEMVRGIRAAVELDAVPAEDVISGSPEQGVLELGPIGGAEVGIWELRGGTVTDTEVDEMFVVLSGGATIDLLDGPGVEPGTVVEVGPGDVMRLVAGTRTRWTVEDHIRKVYIAA